MKSYSRVAWSQAISPLAAIWPEPHRPAAPVTSLLDRFAEEIAEHGDIARASTAIRVPIGTGQDLFSTLCRRMGAQADE